uniref:FecR family protein n=1 Tax=uncultured Draconibacterium sp. TaxID=1573823 RepID=UPI003217F0B7
MINDKMKQERIIEHLTNEEKKDGDEVFDTWLNANEGNKEEFEVLKKIWRVSKKVGDIRYYSTEEGWINVNDKIQKKKDTKHRIVKFSYALAGIAATLIILLGFNFFFNQDDLNANSLIVETDYGNRSEVTLPDGSVVHLNAGTSVEFYHDFSKGLRTVKFSGEGFFKVAKSDDPFVVEMYNGFQVKVHGTEFNITAYPEEPKITTTLVEGKVELFNLKSETITMEPGQIVLYSKQTDKMNFVNGDSGHNIGWLNDKIYLDQTSLTETVKLLERRYNVRFVFEPSGFGDDINYSGVLEEKSIHDVLEALKELSQIEYTINGKEIKLMRK